MYFLKLVQGGDGRVETLRGIHLEHLQYVEHVTLQVGNLQNILRIGWFTVCKGELVLEACENTRFFEANFI